MQPDSTPTPQFSDTTPAPPRRQQSKESLGSILSTVIILIVAPLIALFLTAFVFQSYEVDGPSMESTLQNKDRLIVWKAPRTVARVTKNNFIPARGEIVIFVKHGLSDFGSSGDKQLIKRVIGLPGERVVVKNGEVKVYNAEHPEGFNPDTSGIYQTDPLITNGNTDQVVQDGEVFVLGDNRANSLDSRSFGTVSSDDLVGVLAFRIFPFNKARGF